MNYLAKFCMIATFYAVQLVSMSSSQHVLGGEGTHSTGVVSPRYPLGINLLAPQSVQVFYSYPLMSALVALPLIIMACAAFPMTYLAYRGLARFVLSSKHDDMTSLMWCKNTSVLALAAAVFSIYFPYFTYLRSRPDQYRE